MAYGLGPVQAGFTKATTLNGWVQGSPKKAAAEKALTTALVAFAATKLVGKTSMRAAAAAAGVTLAINGAVSYKSVDSLKGESAVKEAFKQAALAAAAVGAARLLAGKGLTVKRMGAAVGVASAFNAVGAQTEYSRHVLSTTLEEAVDTLSEKKIQIKDYVAPADVSDAETVRASVVEYIQGVVNAINDARTDGADAAELVSQTLVVKGLKEEIETVNSETKLLTAAMTSVEKALEPTDVEGKIALHGNNGVNFEGLDKLRAEMKDAFADGQDFGAINVLAKQDDGA